LTYASFKANSARYRFFPNRGKIIFPPPSAPLPFAAPLFLKLFERAARYSLGISNIFAAVRTPLEEGILESPFKGLCQDGFYPGMLFHDSWGSMMVFPAPGDTVVFWLLASPNLCCPFPPSIIPDTSQVLPLKRCGFTHTIF